MDKLRKKKCGFISALLRNPTKRGFQLHGFQLVRPF